ncbi:MAG: histidine kinase [Actinomycetota bacterium]|nr:histidine kinase [Actinomycetota bacterium]
MEDHPRSPSLSTAVAQGASTHAMIETLVLRPPHCAQHVRDVVMKLVRRSKLEAVAVAARAGTLPGGAAPVPTAMASAPGPSASAVDEATCEGLDPGTAALRDPFRLAELRRARLLDTPAEESFDRLARLATRLLRAPVALVSLVDEERQFFKSCIGLTEPLASARQTALSHSVCQYEVVADSPLVVADARRDPRLFDNAGVLEMGVVAYAGVPIRTRAGYPLGSFCVIDTQPRDWSEEDVAALSELAAAVSDLIELRVSDLDAAEHKAALGQLVAAQEAERARIAGEIHDDTLQVITAASIRLQMLRRRVNGSATEMLESLVDTVDHASERLRRLLFDLRPSALDHDSLADVLRAYLGETFGHDSPSWAVNDELVAEPPDSVRLVLFRVAQQGLANVLAHARAGHVAVTVAPDAGGIALTVADDGLGFGAEAALPQPGHLGLITMRERTEAAGGRLTICTGAGQGTAVRAWVPVAST